MKPNKIQKNTGFTLIETMIAVFILAAAINGLLGLISNSLYSARYAKNEIVANYLIQEVADYIRNDRDTVAFQKFNGGDWDSFRNNYRNKGCFDAEGCEIEPAYSTISACNGDTSGWGSVGCSILNYYEDSANNNDLNDFYTYRSMGIPSNFKRKITMVDSANNSPDELDITVVVEWKNGNLVRSRTLNTSLLNWQR